MTPQARLASAVELLGAIQAESFRPADAVASYYFRKRRFIGSKDRRYISDLAWDVLRGYRRTEWRIKQAGGDVSPRMMALGYLSLIGTKIKEISALADGGKFSLSPPSPKELSVLTDVAGRGLIDGRQPAPVRFEFPDWAEPFLRARFEDDFDAQLGAMLERPHLDLRVNTIKIDRAQVMRALEKEGLTPKPTSYSPWGVRLEGRAHVTGLADFMDGKFEIQDEAGQLAALLADARPGTRVLDYCAGAGGKTLALAATMENKGRIVACDVFEKRLEGAVKRIRRAGVDNVARHLLEDGDKWGKRQKEAFDLAFVDAPCTGTGTWRRNPDARRTLRENDLRELIVKQAEIMDKVAPMVKKGGRLLYATCSVLDEENDGQIRAFLARHPDFQIDAGKTRETLDKAGIKQAQDDGGHAGKPRDKLEGCLRLTPHSHGTDGFFACVLKKSA